MPSWQRVPCPLCVVCHVVLVAPPSTLPLLCVVCLSLNCTPTRYFNHVLKRSPHCASCAPPSHLPHRHYMLGGSDPAASSRKGGAAAAPLSHTSAVLGPCRIGFDPTLGACGPSHATWPQLAQHACGRQEHLLTVNVQDSKHALQTRGMPAFHPGSVLQDLRCHSSTAALSTSFQLLCHVSQVCFDECWGSGRSGTDQCGVVLVYR